MKNLYFIVILLFCGVAFAQNENNHWVMGPIHIDFSTTPPTASIISGIRDLDYNQSNCHAAVSDANGNLMFSFGGITSDSSYLLLPRDKNFDPIPMADTSSNYSSSWTDKQPAIIIPHPGDKNKYYLIWSIFDTPGYGNVYFYSIIDFTNNALGEVLPINNPDENWTWSPRETEYIKQLKDENGVAIHSEWQDQGGYGQRPLTFTKNANSNGYWLVIQSRSKILTYKVDPSGLNPLPAVSTFPNLSNAALMFRIVPDYNNLNNAKLFGIFQGGLFSLDFNKSTGQMSNYISIPTNTTYGLEYFEFSPDYKKVYFTVNTSIYNQPDSLVGQIYVKDLTSLSTPARRLYESDNPTNASSLFYMIQKDKYNNVLVGSWHDSQSRNKYLHKIENPNSFLNSSVKLNYVYMNGKKTFAFPQLVQTVAINCYDDLVLSAVETKLDYAYKANNTIIANGSYTINSGSNIKFQAGQAIYLEPNTDIKQGAIFDTTLIPCTGYIEMRMNMSEDEDTSTSTEELPSNTFAMYPNPSDNITTFSLSDDVIKSISIYSLDGRTVFAKDIMEKEYALDVKDYPKGVYIASVTTLKGETITKKLVKN